MIYATLLKTLLCGFHFVFLKNLTIKEAETSTGKLLHFEAHPSNMPVIFFHRTRESTEYTVLTHTSVYG